MVHKRTLLIITLLGLYPHTLKAPAQKPVEEIPEESIPTPQDISAFSYFKNKYPGIAALLPLDTFKKRPWAHDREERLNGVKELVETAKKHLDSIINTSNLAYAEKVKANYTKMFDEIRALLKMHKDRFGVNFQKLMDDANAYEVAYANYVFKALAEDEQDEQKPEWQKEQVSTQESAQSSDPEWSEALGKQEMGSDITVRNNTNKPLFIAVYESFNDKQPKRYGNVYDINAGATITIKRPVWDTTTRIHAKNNRFLFFANNKKDLGYDAGPQVLGSIKIGEGGNLFKPETSFTIKPSDLKK